MELSASPLRRTRSPFARLLHRLLADLEYGSLSVDIGGQQLRIEGPRSGPAGHIRVARPLRLLRRLLLGGDIGFAEAYMAGEWDSRDLTALLRLLALNEHRLEPAYAGSLPSRWLRRWRHARNANTRHGSARNIASHYDLGNHFYQLWLDPGMTYSAARFDRADMTLGEAQDAKYRRMLELARPRPGAEVLEIGCGWGGFAAYAATRGHRVTGITLSREQLAWARTRTAAAGVGDRVDLRLCDYRDLDGRYASIVSIEMFEAVGETYWDTYMQRLAACLEPGGRAALQVITIDERRFARYREHPDFIQRYIFPGGMLPTVGAFDAAAQRAGLRVVEREFGGADYARTLRAWRDAFVQHGTRLEALGYDRWFQRMWLYYLGYCEAGFRSGAIDVMRLALQHDR